MAERIDELQLFIGSDASDAIRELGNLASALDIASSAASRLAGTTARINSFTSSLAKLSSIKLDNAIRGLETLSNLKLDNLKDKTVSIDLQVNGADKADRIALATNQAAKTVAKNMDQVAKELGREFKMDTGSISTLRDLVKDYVNEVKENRDGKNVIDSIANHISSSSQKATADILGMRSQMQAFVDEFDNTKFNPDKGVSKEARNFWIKNGFLRNLDSSIGSDISSVWQDKTFRELADGFVDLNETNPENMFWQLADAVLYCKSALNEYVDDFETAGKIQERVNSVLGVAPEKFNETYLKKMAESKNAIPLDLDIDQNRFESKIQEAITKATSNKTYHAKPIQFDLDVDQLRQNIDNVISSIDFNKLPQFAISFQQMSDAISQMNQTNLKDTGIAQFTNSVRKLVSTDTSKFDVGAFSAIVTTIKDLANIGDVSKSLNGFVSAIARLAGAGDKVLLAATGMKELGPELRSTATMFKDVGGIEPTAVQLVAAISKLAAAGSKAEETAISLPKLSAAVRDFIDAMSGVQIDEHIANTINGLGNLAAAGTSAGKAMNTALGGSGSKLGSFSGIGVKSLSDSLKKLVNVSVQLGAQGTSALGRFLAKLHLIPSSAHSIDRTALSFTNLLRAIIPFYGIRGIFNWGKEAFEAGSSIVELENVIDTAFGNLRKGYEDISGYIYKWAEGTIDAFGVSQIAAEKYAGRLMSMFNSSGFDVTEGMRDSAAKMTTELIERAGDIASFYDVTVDEAMTKIQSGLAGMTRPLRSIGVNMSVANLEAFALSKGITTSWQSMDQATQMALRYKYILEATQYAEGDFGRTSLSAANQVRLLQLNTQQLAATLGQGLVSAIAPVLGWLNVLIRKLVQAANAFRIFMWTLFGKPLSAAKGISDEMAGYLDDSSSAASDLASGAGGASDGLGNAGKAAKELKKQLTVLPFDELNQLAKDTNSASSGSGGSGGGGGGGGLGGLDALGLDGLDGYDLSGNKTIEAINKWAERIRKAFENKQWANLGKIVAEGINSGLKFIYDALDWNKLKPKIVDGFIVPFQTAFNSMMAWIDWPLLGHTLARGLNDIVYTLRAWITGFQWKKYGIYFAEGMNGMLEELDADALGRLIADKFKAAWDFFGGWVSTFDFSLLGEKLKEGISGAIDELNPEDMGRSLGTFITGLGTTLRSMFEDGDLRKDVAEALKEFVNGFLKEFDAKEVMTGINSFVDTIVGAIADIISGTDKTKLIESFTTVLSGLPWPAIAFVIGARHGASLAAGIFGSYFKNKAASLISNVFGGSVAGATSTSAATTAGVSSAGTISLGALVATTLGVTTITLGGIKIGTWLDKKLRELFPLYGKGADAQKTAKESGATGGSTSYSSVWSNFGNYSPGNAGSGTQTASTEVITTRLEAVVAPSMQEALKEKLELKKDPVATQTLNAVQTKEYKSYREGFKKWVDNKATKMVNADPTNAYNSTQRGYEKWDDDTATKTAHGQTTPRYTSVHKNWLGWLGETILKFANADASGEYGRIHRNWLAWLGETILKTANGTGTNDYWNISKDYKGIQDKTVTVTVKQNDVIYDLSAVNAYNEKIAYLRWERSRHNAKGGLFTGATGLQVFGEAGMEAAIPLERKSTMKRIADAIVDSGGLQTSTNTGLAREIAFAIAPIVMDAMSESNKRPINVNATLYTENDEVLARAVNRGQRSIDKRYNPVSRFSY